MNFSSTLPLIFCENIKGKFISRMYFLQKISERAMKRLPRGYPKLIQRLHRGYPEATQRPPRGHSEATQRAPRGHPEATLEAIHRLHRDYYTCCLKATRTLPRGYSGDT